MGTTNILRKREFQTIRRIDSVLDADKDLESHRMDIRITIENAQIMLRGHLPTPAMRQKLVQVIRQAGVMGQICNCVQTG